MGFNKFEQVSSDDYQMLVAGGGQVPRSDVGRGSRYLLQMPGKVDNTSW